jgi:hypothetical protein
VSRSAKVIDAKTAINEGETNPIDTLGAAEALMQAVWTGTLTAGVVTFEGTHVDPPPTAATVGDRAKWVPLGTASFVTGGGTGKVAMPAGDGYRYVRARITTALVGGGTVDVYIGTGGFAPGGWN